MSLLQKQRYQLLQLASDLAVVMQQIDDPVLLTRISEVIMITFIDPEPNDPYHYKRTRDLPLLIKDVCKVLMRNNIQNKRMCLRLEHIAEDITAKKIFQ